MLKAIDERYYLAIQSRNWRY